MKLEIKFVEVMLLTFELLVNFLKIKLIPHYMEVFFSVAGQGV